MFSKVATCSVNINSYEFIRLFQKNFERLFPILSKASSILCTIPGASATATLTGSVLEYLRVGVRSFKTKTKITSFCYTWVGASVIQKG